MFQASILVYLIQISSREKLYDFEACHLAARVLDPTDMRRILIGGSDRARRCPSRCRPLPSCSDPFEGVARHAGFCVARRAAKEEKKKRREEERKKGAAN